MITLYGIKNCDTVKKARTWLEQKGIAYNFHDFRADGLSETQIRRWINELGLDALVNKRSTTWKELDDASKAKLDAANAVALIAQHPTLIKRPLLDTGSHKQLGFNAADYQQLFN